MFSKNKVENSHFILSEINSKISLDSNHTTHNHTGPKFRILVQPKCLVWRPTRLNPFVSALAVKKQNCTFPQRGLLVHLMWVEESFIPGGCCCILRSLNMLSWAPACTYEEHASLHRASAGVRQHLLHNGGDKYYNPEYQELHSWLTKQGATHLKGHVLIESYGAAIAGNKQNLQKSMLPMYMSQVLSIIIFSKINTFQPGNLTLFWAITLWSG